jgi:segregation and condensation protein B
MASSGRDGDSSSAERTLQGTLDDGLRKAIEAVLLVAEEPVPVDVLAATLDADAPTVLATLKSLRRAYVDAGHGFVLREAGGGWRFYTDPGAAAYVERFLLRGRSGRVSQAALETLAIVAYEQPVTRARVSEIRGVDADGAMRTLVSRGLVGEVGRADTLGQPLLYGTTTDLLARLGLQSLEELPPLAELDPRGPAPAEPPVGGYRQARRELDALEDDGAPAPDTDEPHDDRAGPPMVRSDNERGGNERGGDEPSDEDPNTTSKDELR